jgi:hypothetical protein
MEKKVIERQINFEAPNTIGLNAKLWNKQPVGAFTRDVVFYGMILAILVLAGFLSLAPHTAEWISVGSALTLLIAVGSLLLRNSLVEKHRVKHFNYRQTQILSLAKFLEGHGYLLSETEQKHLTVILRPNFTVTAEGITYRTSGLEIDEDKISTLFVLSDTKVDNDLRRADREGRIERIVVSHEKQTGQFASPELREAFAAGVRRALR